MMYLTDSGNGRGIVIRGTGRNDHLTSHHHSPSSSSNYFTRSSSFDAYNRKPMSSGGSSSSTRPMAVGPSAGFDSHHHTHHHHYPSYRTLGSATPSSSSGRHVVSTEPPIQPTGSSAGYSTLRSGAHHTTSYYNYSPHPNNYSNSYGSTYGGRPSRSASVDRSASSAMIIDRYSAHHDPLFDHNNSLIHHGHHQDTTHVPGSGRLSAYASNGGVGQVTSRLDRLMAASSTVSADDRLSLLGGGNDPYSSTSLLNVGSSSSGSSGGSTGSNIGYSSLSSTFNNSSSTIGRRYAGAYEEPRIIPVTHHQTTNGIGGGNVRGGHAATLSISDGGGDSGGESSESKDSLGALRGGQSSHHMMHNGYGNNHHNLMSMSINNTTTGSGGGALYQTPRGAASMPDVPSAIAITSPSPSSSLNHQSAGAVGSTTVTVNGTTAVANNNNGAFNRTDVSRSSGSSEESSSGSSSRGSRAGHRRALPPTPVEQQQSTTNNNNSGKAGLLGLQNIGNTCFMSSMLQCLSHTKPLRKFCLAAAAEGTSHYASANKGALFRAYCNLLRELWDANRSSYLTPSDFKSQIQKFAPRFVGYSQQDSQEFLRYLLQGLHEDINRAVKGKALPPVDDSQPDDRKAEDCWQRYLRIDNSPIVDMFVGQLKSELRCTHCGHVSTTFDPFWDLSLPIPSDRRESSVSLASCLAAFTKEEILDGDEKPKCEKCKTHQKCTKKFFIHRFPQILVLHLKRFSGERYRSRLSTLVNFPTKDLDLSKSCGTAGSSVRSTAEYNLFGVSNHSGTPTMGHYTAYCKHAITNKWHLYDDTRVTSVSEQSVITNQAYVLFYQAKD